MLLAEDDYPLHQTVLPLAHVMDGHPNAYDRFWFNGCLLYTSRCV